MTTRSPTLWLLRIAWAVLPLTAGGALADAVSSWPVAPRTVAFVLLWAGWAAVLLATFAPRPAGLTALRIGGPVCLAVVALAVVAGDVDTGATAAAIPGAAVAALLAIAPPVAAQCVQGAAYGDERRIPLRIPPVLLLGPVPVAVAAVAAGVASGPLLVADGRLGWGIPALVIGLPLAAALTRSLHVLARRIAVAVPAGLVVADPLTLLDAVLLPHSRLAAFAVASARLPTDPGTVDLRLGAVRRSLRIDFGEPVALTLRPRPGRPAASTAASAVLVAPTDVDAVVAAVAARARRTRAG